MTTHAEALARWRTTLDRLGPHRGSCGLCGADDARHRAADAITGTWIAGDPAPAIAADYGVTTDTVYEITAAALLVETTARRQRIPRAAWWSAAAIAAALLLTGCADDTPLTGTVADRWHLQHGTHEAWAISVRVQVDGEIRTPTMRVTRRVYDACRVGATWHRATGTCTLPGGRP